MSTASSRAWPMTCHSCQRICASTWPALARAAVRGWTGDQGADVLADAGVPGRGRADAGDQRQEGAGHLRVGQQPGLQHLRLRHAVLRPGRTQVGIVLHRQQRDLGDSQRRRMSMPS